MTQLDDQILTLLEDVALDDESLEKDGVDLVEDLITEENWPQVQQTLIDLLADDGQSARIWHLTLCLFWGALGDKRPVDGDRVLALANLRDQAFETDDQHNLVWSLACKIKGVSYLSDYEPRHDPAVVKYLIEYGGEGVVPLASRSRASAQSNPLLEQLRASRRQNRAIMIAAGVILVVVMATDFFRAG